MKLLSRVAVLSGTTLVCIVCDQSAKALAQHHLFAHASKSYFAGVINLVYAENTGTVLGLGENLPEAIRFTLFVLLDGVVLALATAYLMLNPLNNRNVLAISLIVGGGVSNIIDRLIHNGAVIDFMLIKIGSLETGIFNLADLAISLDVCLLCLSLFRVRARGDIPRS